MPKPTAAPPRPPPGPPRRPPGADRRLRLSDILKLLVNDGWVGADDGGQARADARPRCAPARWSSSPSRSGSRLAPPHKLLTLEALVEWLAGKLGVPYVHVDPLKIDLVAVTQTMSNAYAERYRILPIEVTRDTLRVATSEPFVRAWADELESILRLKVELVFANPVDIRRYMGEFYTLARSMKKAQETSHGEISLARNFEQLVELGRARQPRRQRPARRPHRRLAVAVRVRAARLRHPRRAAARRRAGALSHRRRAAPGLRDPGAGAARGHLAGEAAGADGDRREAPAAGRPDQDGGPGRAGGRAAHLDHADGVRREDRDAHLHPGGAGPRLLRAGLLAPRTATAGRR